MPAGGWIGTHEDVTSRELAAEKIQFAAHHDTLTGLANRTLFNAKLDEALNAASANGIAGDLMLLDLDKFKPVNDSFGHDVGDELLKTVAQRLRECVRSSDLVARLGGDEFGIILTGTGSATPVQPRLLIVSSARSGHRSLSRITLFRLASASEFLRLRARNWILVQ